MLAKRTTVNGRQADLSRELQRLKRQDLLELLVAQLKEGERLQAIIADNEATIDELTDLSERLKAKLDDKDAQIERLKGKLNDKDAQIERFKGKLNDKDAQIERFKGKLNDKDAQIERFKVKLNDKDAQIERLKARLNEKDETIERLHEREHNMARAHGAIDMQKLLEAEERAIDDYIREIALAQPDVTDEEVDRLAESDDESARGDA